MQDEDQSETTSKDNEDYKYISVDDRKLKDIAAREKSWVEREKRKPGTQDPRSKFLSNNRTADAAAL